MKESWESLCSELEDFKSHLEELIETLPQSAKFHRMVMGINKDWNKIKKAVSDMDGFIVPAKSIPVINALLANPELKTAWGMWKDYLSEQHGIFMRSRAELYGLKRLQEISGGDPAKAVKYLEFCMSRPTDKNFYKVEEIENKHDTTAQTAEPMKVKLPKLNQ